MSKLQSKAGRLARVRRDAALSPGTSCPGWLSPGTSCLALAQALRAWLAQALRVWLRSVLSLRDPLLDISQQAPPTRSVQLRFFRVNHAKRDASLTHGPHQSLFH